MKNKFLAFISAVWLLCAPLTSMANITDPGCERSGNQPSKCLSVPEIDGALGLQVLGLCAGIAALIKRKK